MLPSAASCLATATTEHCACSQPQLTSGLWHSQASHGSLAGPTVTATTRKMIREQCTTMHDNTMYPRSAASAAKATPPAVSMNCTLTGAGLRHKMQCSCPKCSSASLQGLYKICEDCASCLASQALQIAQAVRICSFHAAALTLEIPGAGSRAESQEQDRSSRACVYTQTPYRKQRCCAAVT